MHVLAAREARFEFLQVTSVEVDDHRLHAEFQKVLHHPLADAAGTAGDEGDAAGEDFHILSLAREGSECGIAAIWPVALAQPQCAVQGLT